MCLCVRVCMCVSVGGEGGSWRGKIKPTQSSSYVTVRITDVPTDTQCGLWAEACGEPVWLQLARFFGLCARIIICRPAACVNGASNTAVAFTSAASD